MPGENGEYKYIFINLTDLNQERFSQIYGSNIIRKGNVFLNYKVIF